MKEEYKELGTIILAMILAGLIVGGVYFYQNPKDDYKYCMRHRPEFNSTNDRSYLCYTIYWEDYCKIRSPWDCPGFFKEDKNLNLPNITDIFIKEAE